MTLPWIEPTQQCQIIQRDVCIYGSGATASYAALRLSELGLSVVIVETSFHGCYDDEKWLPQLQALSQSKSKPSNDKSNNDAFITEGPTKLSMALTRFATLKSSFVDMENMSGVAKDVPEELLISTADFVAKHRLEPLVPALKVLLWGWPSWHGVSALYLISNVSVDDIIDLLAGERMHLAAKEEDVHSCSEDYTMFVAGTVTLTDRRGTEGVKLWVHTPHGVVQVQTQHILVTCPATMDSLAGVDLTDNEVEIFSALRSTNHWNGLISGIELLDQEQCNDGVKGPAYESIEILDLQYCDQHAKRRLYAWSYTSPELTSQFQTEERVLHEVNRLIENGNLRAGHYETPEIVFSKHHRRGLLTVDAESIKTGFYTRLDALQGRDHTFWLAQPFTGISTESVLTYFDKHVLPKLKDQCSVD